MQMIALVGVIIEGRQKRKIMKGRSLILIQNKIKRLNTFPNFDTAGSVKVVYYLVKNIDRTIYEPEICCFHSRGSFMDEIKKLGVKIHLFPFAINYRPFFTFPIRLIKIIRLHIQELELVLIYFLKHLIKVK